MTRRAELVLMRQRTAVLRAIDRARECRADEDVAVLQSLINLLESLHDALVFDRKPKPTSH